MFRSPENQIIKRYQGCLVGAAVGDALGAPAEFFTPDQIAAKYNGPLKEMVGGGVFNWRVGQTTDDTDMSMAVIDSFINKNGYDPADIANGFVKWMRGKPKDIGGTTHNALLYIAQGMDYRQSGYELLNKVNTAPNGSIMRTHPFGLMFRGDSKKMSQASSEVSAMTHAHRECRLACRMTSELVGDLAGGTPKDEAVGNLVQKFKDDDTAVFMVNQALNGEFYQDVYPGGGYVFESFNIALNALMNHDNFEDSVVFAVNLGGDADSQATVAGALAGAHYGIDAIPERWKKPLNPFTAEELAQKAKQIYLLNKQMTQPASPKKWWNNLPFRS